MNISIIKKRPVIMTLKTCQPVDYKESAIVKALAEDGQLLVEPKHDGVQLNITVDTEGVIHYLSRAGIEFEALRLTTQNLSKLLKEYSKSSLNQYRKQGFMVQGELVALDENGVAYPATSTAGILRRKDAPHESIAFSFIIFAVLPLDEVLGGKPIEKNRIQLNMQAGVFLWGLRQTAESPKMYPTAHKKDNCQIGLEVVQQVAVCTLEEDPVVKDGMTIPSLMGYYRVQRSQGLEGVVAFRIGQPWHRGKKTGAWKVKPNETHDGTIVGFFKGQAEATKDFIVGFEVELEDGHVANVDGFTATLSREVTDNPDSYLGLSIEVSCMERFTTGALRHPKFKSFRGINDLTVKE